MAGFALAPLAPKREIFVGYTQKHPEVYVLVEHGTAEGHCELQAIVCDFS